MKVFGKMPDDPFYEDIDPYLKVWLYESWIRDQEEESKKLRDLVVFLGSFSNPEMAKNIYKSENPDYNSTDFDKASENVRKEILESERQKESKQRKQKKRKVIK